ncbi:hypothetical protein D9M68_897050 [compost metagenome]
MTDADARRAGMAASCLSRNRPCDLCCHGKADRATAWKSLVHRAAIENHACREVDLRRLDDPIAPDGSVVLRFADEDLVGREGS